MDEREDRERLDRLSFAAFDARGPVDYGEERWRHEQCAGRDELLALLDRLLAANRVDSS